MKLRLQTQNCAGRGRALGADKGRNARHASSGRVVSPGARCRLRVQVASLLLHRQKKSAENDSRFTMGGSFRSEGAAARKSSFCWPRESQDVKEHCRSCHGCQVISPLRQKYRVQIMTLASPSSPFQIVNMNCIGPLDPPSARGLHYTLWILDLQTRWS